MPERDDAAETSDLDVAPLLDQVNLVTVSVHLTVHPSQPSLEVWSAAFENADLDGPLWTRDWLVHEVGRLTRLGEEPAPYDLQLKQDRWSWGADASGYSVLLHVADWVGAGVAGSVAYAAFLKLVRYMKERMIAAGISTGTVDFDRDEAVERARWRIEVEFQRNPEELRLVSEDHSIDDHIWTITFVDAEETQYEVTLGIVDGLPLTSRLIRRPQPFGE